MRMSFSLFILEVWLTHAAVSCLVQQRQANSHRIVYWSQSSTSPHTRLTEIYWGSELDPHSHDVSKSTHVTCTTQECQPSTPSGKSPAHNILAGRYLMLSLHLKCVCVCVLPASLRACMGERVRLDRKKVKGCVPTECTWSTHSQLTGALPVNHCLGFRVNKSRNLMWSLPRTMVTRVLDTQPPNVNRASAMTPVDIEMTLVSARAPPVEENQF